SYSNAAFEGGLYRSARKYLENCHTRRGRLGEEQESGFRSQESGALVAQVLLSEPAALQTQQAEGSQQWSVISRA
ncbi:MAG: hypothetical protein WCD04_01785, partial [Terriglobia bacterium]